MNMATKLVININTLTDNKRFLKLREARVIAAKQNIIEMMCIVFIFCNQPGK